MRFERLRLSGFKSFVEPTELVITDGLTGVVGPNGCGKSNLLEALRWAMGETSPKSLRGGVMDELIFAGTATRPARDIAEVTISLTHDGEEVQVSRRLRRGEGSSWRLNGRETRARDVALLFADAATGAHSPAMVGQGRVAAIIAARPDERRALLEEAAGSSGLHARRRDADQKLRAAEANLARVADLSAGSEAQAGTLRRQARGAARYSALSAEMATLEAAALRLRWEAAQVTLRTAEEALDLADAQAVAAAAAAEGTRAAETVAGAKLAGARASAAQAAGDVQAAAVAHARAAGDLDVSRAKAADATQSLAAMRSEHSREAARLLDAETILKRLEADLAGAIVERTTAIAAIPVAEAAEAAAVERLDLAERALGEAVQAHAALLADHRSTRVARDATAARQATLEREIGRLDSEALALPAVDTAAFELAIKAVRGADAELTGSSAAVASAEIARAEAEAARPLVERALHAAEADVSALRSEHATLARLLKMGGAGGRLEVHAEAGFEAAAAAALGDDGAATLSRSARYWAGVPPQPQDPELPPAATPITQHMAVPTQLSRAVGQIGLVEHEPGLPEIAALFTGQRLVHRDGRAWRWDGLVSEPGGAEIAVTEALRQQNRRAEIARILGPAEQRLAAISEEAMRKRDALAAAIAAETAARAQRSTAERARDQMRAQLEVLERDASRSAARRDALQATRVRLVAEYDAAAMAAVAAGDALAALPDLSCAAMHLANARTAADQARASLSNARAAAAALRRSRTEADQRIARLQRDREDWEVRVAESEGALAAVASRLESEQAREAALTQIPAGLSSAVAELESRLEGARAAAAAASEAVAVAESELLQATVDETTARARAAATREQAASDAVRRDFARDVLHQTMAECLDRLGRAPDHLPPALGDAAATAARLASVTADRDRLGAVNLLAAHELAEVEAVIADRARQSAELEDAIQRLRASIIALNREGRSRLAAAHTAVDAHFQSLFGTLFAGGQARLLLLDSEDPLDAGLEILAQPPGKRLQSLGLLSGGEQALTALALIFALFLANAAPICVLDEVDAALDDANVERLCAMLEQMVEHTGVRFLIVSHHPLTIARMHRLYGVTMVEPGVSRLVSVDLDEARRLAA